jgi:hypothetical protein
MASSDPVANEEDPLVTELVEAAIAPHRGTIPPEELEIFRARMVLFYETNPEAVELLEAIRRDRQQQPAAVARSGEREVRSASDLEEASRRTKKRSAG